MGQVRASSEIVNRPLRCVRAPYFSAVAYTNTALRVDYCVCNPIGYEDRYLPESCRFANGKLYCCRYAAFIHNTPLSEERLWSQRSLPASVHQAASRGTNASAQGDVVLGRTCLLGRWDGIEVRTERSLLK